MLEATGQCATRCLLVIFAPSEDSQSFRAQGMNGDWRGCSGYVGEAFIAVQYWLSGTSVYNLNRSKISKSENKNKLHGNTAM